MPFEQTQREISFLTQVIMQEREQRLTLTQELIFERQKNQQLEEFIKKLSNMKWEKLEIKDEVQDFKGVPLVGAYKHSIRKRKIMKYKEKVRKYREKVSISRSFEGRSVAAKLKPRFNGKFAKKKFYEEVN